MSQLTGAYTFNFAYVGSRTTGNDGGSFAIAGPHWQGPTPKGVKLDRAGSMGRGRPAWSQLEPNLGRLACVSQRGNGTSYPA